MEPEQPALSSPLGSVFELIRGSPPGWAANVRDSAGPVGDSRKNSGGGGGFTVKWPRPPMPRSSPLTLDSAALTELRAIYAAIESRPVPRDCILRTGCCHFRLTGRTPQVTKAEALYAAKGARASGRPTLKPHPDGACPLLGANGRCTIYDHRPFGCRTHFCAEAGGPYARREVVDLIQRLEALDERLGHHDGSRPFVPALEEAMGK